jgi:hypothetical protein
MLQNLKESVLSDMFMGCVSPAGFPKSVAIVTPSAIDTQTTAHVEVTLDVRNGLGLFLPADAPCFQAAEVRFEVTGAAATALQAHHQPGGAGWTFKVSFIEENSPVEDVHGLFEAVLQLGSLPSLRSAPIGLRYVPREKLRYQSESQLQELRALHGQKAVAERRRSEVTQLYARRAEAHARLEAAQAALRALPPLSALEQGRADVEHRLTLLRSATAFDPPVANLQNHRGGPGLDNFLQDRANGRLEPHLAAATLGVVGELGYVMDPWSADAIAAIAGDKLQVLVVRTERDVDIVWRMPRYRGLKVMALENRGRQCPRTTRQGLVELARCALRNRGRSFTSTPRPRPAPHFASLCGAAGEVPALAASAPHFWFTAVAFIESRSATLRGKFAFRRA